MVKDSTVDSTTYYKLSLTKDRPTNIKAGFMRLFLTVVYLHIRVNRILSGRWQKIAVIFTLRNSISCC